jgi:hypothetical protein
MNDGPGYGSLFLTGNFPVYKGARFLEAVPSRFYVGQN